MKIVNAGEATGERSFFSDGCVLSVLWQTSKKGKKKIVLERKMESMSSAR